MTSVLFDTLRIIGDSSPYLLLGFLLSGVIQVALRRGDWVSRLLSGPGHKPVIWAALIGAPLPLCSCSVLPAALTLRRHGASKGATASFLISVPETDIVSIALTWGLLGPLMAVFRPLAAVITAVVTGLAVNAVERWRPEPTEAAGAAPAEHEHASPERGKLRDALRYGFVELFDDLIGSLLIGLLVGGAVTALMPALGLTRATGGSIWTMLAMAALGVPSYVCASATTPIAVGLIVGGISPGAALVFLLSGPATNAGTILVLWRQLGRAATAIYIACIVVVSILMGFWLDAVVGRDLPGMLTVTPTLSETLGPVQVGGLVAFAILTAASFVRTHGFSRGAAWISSVTGLPIRPALLKIVLTGGPVAVWAASGLVTVQPGERAFRRTFGAVTGNLLEPGLHPGWPAPIGSVDRVSVTEIRRAEIGLRGVDASTAAVEASWLLIGSEDLVDMRCMVQYRVIDAPRAVWRFLYGVESADAVMRRAVESALRAALATRSIDTVYSTDRAEIERRVGEDLLPPILARLDAGLSVLSVSLIEIHGPPPVHAAFRDVASAVEDQARLIGAAYEHEERVTREAYADAAARVASGRAAAYEFLKRATGEARAFELQRASYADAPEIARTRLYLECLDAVLPRVPKVLRLGVAADLWLTKAGLPPAVNTPEEPSPPTPLDHQP